MSTKKEKRTIELKGKKQKKSIRISVLVTIIVVLVGFLIFFFVSLFDFIFPPNAGKASIAKRREKRAVILYFSDINERFLLPEKRFVPKEIDIDRQAEELVKALLDGSKTNLVNTFPEKASFQSISIDQSKTAHVSFSKDLIRFHPGGSASEMATIYSLTNTLIYNIPAIEKVKLLIDEKELKTIKGHVDTRYPFFFNKESIAPGS